MAKKRPDVTGMTRQNLMDAYWDLYTTTQLSKLTVKMVTDRAGYNRGTFYAYFTDLKELQEQEIDTLILGCTHYPLLRSTIRKIMGEEVCLVNPAYETALELKKLLSRLDLASNEVAQEEFPYRFYVSDLAEKFKYFANSILPYNVEKTQKIDIEKY